MTLLRRPCVLLLKKYEMKKNHALYVMSVTATERRIYNVSTCNNRAASLDTGSKEQTFTGHEGTTDTQNG
jgi:hypothetical protein